MIYELTNADKQAIESYMGGETAAYMKLVRSQKFNVGDILIRKTVEFYNGKPGEQHVQTYPLSTLPVRFLIIFVDEDHGMNFCREIGEDGKPFGGAFVINDPSDLGYEEITIFEVDPLFIDGVIFGEDFDLAQILQEERERKKAIVDKNKEISKIFTDLKSLNKYIKSLKPNDIIYWHSASKQRIMDNTYREFLIKRSRKYQLKNYKQTHNGKRWCAQYRKSMLNDKHVYYLRCQKTNAMMTSIQLLNCAIYTTPPLDLAPQ